MNLKRGLLFTLSSIAIGMVTNFLSARAGLDQTSNADSVTERIVDDREIGIVSYEFSVAQHHWTSRLLGVALLLLPWFFSPLRYLLAEGKSKIQTWVEGHYHWPREDVIVAVKQKRDSLVLSSLLITVGFIVVFYVVLWIAYMLGLGAAGFAFLTLERVLNVLVGLL